MIKFMKTSAVHRATEKLYMGLMKRGEMKASTDTLPSSHRQRRPLNSDEKSNFRTKRWETEWREREMKKKRWKANKSGLICNVRGRPIQTHTDTGPQRQQPHTHTHTHTHILSGGHGLSRDCPPLTSSNGFTFLGLVGTNILYGGTHTHKADGGC